MDITNMSMSRNLPSVTVSRVATASGITAVRDIIARVVVDLVQLLLADLVEWRAAKVLSEMLTTLHLRHLFVLLFFIPLIFGLFIKTKKSFSLVVYLSYESDRSFY